MSAPLAPAFGARERKVAYDRSPAFARFADDVAEGALDAFRLRLASPIEIKRVGVRVAREETLLAAAGRRRLGAMLGEESWDCRAAAVLDAAAVFNLVEAMLGGEGGAAAIDEGRAFTSIERGLARSFAEAVAVGLNASCARFEPTHFAFDRFEPRLEFGTLAQRGEDAAAIDYSFTAFGNPGEFTLMIPQRALDHLALVGAPAPSHGPGDPRWMRDFEHRVTGAEVTLRASSNVDGYTLGDVATLRVGQIIALPTLAQRHVTLSAEDRALFTCELGRSEGCYSVRIAAEHDSEAGRAARVSSSPGPSHE